MPDEVALFAKLRDHCTRTSKSQAQPDLRDLETIVARVGTEPKRIWSGDLKYSSRNMEKQRLLDQVRAKMRVAHYPIWTESAYADWKRNFERQQGTKL